MVTITKFLGRYLLLGFAFLLVWQVAISCAADQSTGTVPYSWQKEVLATVGAVQGDTKVQRAGEAQFKKIAAKSPLYIMDFLSTGKNSKLWWQGVFNAFTPSDRWKPGPDVTHGSLGADSVFGFKQFERAGASYRFVGYVQKGTVRFIKTLPNTSPPSTFTIGTHTAWIEVLPSDRAADFIVESKNEALTTVTVLWGKVRVRNVSPQTKESRVLTSCQEVDVERDQEPGEIKWVSSDTMKELVKRTTIPRTLPEDVPSCERLKSEVILDRTEVYLPPPGVALYPAIVPIPVAIPGENPECCPPGKIYNRRTGQCVCPCPEGERPPPPSVGNGSTVNSVGPIGTGPCGSCRRGASFNSETCTCECPCPGGVLLPGQGCVAQCPEGYNVAYDSSNSPPYRCSYCVQYPPGIVVDPIPPPLSQCQDDTRCDRCQGCVDGNCVPRICREGFFLDRMTCECRPITQNGAARGCAEGQQCPPCQTCQNGFCVSTTNVICSDQQRLNVSTCQCEPLNGSTKPPPTICRSNNDCPQGYECQQGNCVVRQIPPAPTVPEVCDQDSDCGPHGVCQDGRCVVTLPKPERPEVPEIQHAITPHGLPCQANRDCLKGQVCQNGECVTKPQRTPRVEAPQCRKSIDCPIGQVCRKGKCVGEDEPSGPTGSEVTGSYTGPGRIRIGPQFGTQVGPGVGGIQPGSSGVQRQLVPKITPQMPIQRVPRRGRVN
jgi:hypothetical protein